MADTPECGGYSNTSCKNCFSELRHRTLLTLSCFQTSSIKVIFPDRSGCQFHLHGTSVESTSYALRTLANITVTDVDATVTPIVDVQGSWNTKPAAPNIESPFQNGAMKGSARGDAIVKKRNEVRIVRLVVIDGLQSRAYLQHSRRILSSLASLHFCRCSRGVARVFYPLKAGHAKSHSLGNPRVSLA